MSTAFTIRPVRSTDDLTAAAELIELYAASLPVDLAYQDFEAELAGLPGKYAPPAGELLIARGAGGRALGCVALRPIGASGRCEMKRLFLAPEARGLGVGRALIDAIIQAGERLGYGEMLLDTLPSMAAAIGLYEQMGFTRIAPYYAPTPAGTVFMSRTLCAPAVFRAKGEVVAVARGAEHRFSKAVTGEITLLAGLGVDGDAHMGGTVKHRSRVAADPSRPNLRQVHLIHRELFDELAATGLTIAPGDMGENITTRGLPLLELPTGARLRLGARAVIEVTGLRNPCTQLDAFQPGLMRAVLGRGPGGEVIRKAGIMAVVLATGNVRAGDPVVVEPPAPPFIRLQPV